MVPEGSFVGPEGPITNGCSYQPRARFPPAGKESRKEQSRIVYIREILVYETKNLPAMWINGSFSRLA